jgi:hypothetical protein
VTTTITTRGRAVLLLFHGSAPCLSSIIIKWGWGPAMGPWLVPTWPHTDAPSCPLPTSPVAGAGCLSWWEAQRLCLFL